MDGLKSKQAECYWCTSEIFEESIYNIKTFWNRTLEGYPICDKCLGSFKYGKQTTHDQDYERLGIKPQYNTIKKKRGMDKWI